MMNKVVKGIRYRSYSVRETEKGALLFLRCAMVKIESSFTVIFGMLGVHWAMENMDWLRAAPCIVAYLIVLPGALASALAVGKGCRWLAQTIENAS